MEQHENKESFYHLVLVCRLIARSFGNPEISSWTNGDYVSLSGLLSRHTDIHLSPSTLKRIFGKLKTTEKYYPQKATRDGLARYAGFTDWDDFVMQHPWQEVEQATASEEAAAPEVNKTQQKTTPVKWWPVLLLMTAICIIGGWQWLKNSNGREIPVVPVQLVCNNPVGENPHSAVFQLKSAGAAIADSSAYKISFGDGRPDQQIIPGGVITHYYEKPGRYYARLLYRTQPIDTIPIYLKTNTWTATAYSERDTMRVYPLKVPAFGRNGMRVTPTELHSAGIDTLHTFYVDFVHMEEWDVSGDNFIFSAGVTTSAQRPGVRCSQVLITLYGETARHELLLLKPGCVSWSRLFFSEKFIDGASEDLSPVGTDLQQGGHIRLEILDKRVSLTVNGRPLYNTSYEQPLGKLYGIRIAFAGIGTIEKVAISKPDGTIVFKDGK